ncbi:LppA family lipoprotein [Nocardia sp. NPDC019395]|uniref:LppA family lipoprotein n=1 Tax=Nocardia sp. NPDC019395 TaxID=3154686 RepID=UPI0033C73C86
MTRNSTPLRAALTVATCAILLSGCAESVTPPATPSPLGELQTRPPLEQARDDLLAATLQMQDELSALIPGMNWYNNGDPGRRNCSQRRFDGIGARAAYLGNFVSDMPIPDEAWPEALRRVQAIAAQHGADQVSGYSDRPGDHSVEIYGTGNSISIYFGTQLNTVIGPKTGCHLPAAKMPPKTTPTR